jgi:hypothetical protein
MNKMDKKAELTAKQIVTIIILITSFVVILIFFTALNLRERTGEQICRNSVVIRAGNLGKLTSDFNCKTKEVVIEETEPEKIYQEIAELQRNCFWMFGEGELDIGSGVCAICNIVEFENEVQGAYKIDYLSYLHEKNVSGKEDVSYIKYFTGVDQVNTDKIENFDFNKNKKYMVYYIWRETAVYHLGVREYDSETIDSLECKDLATELV